MVDRISDILADSLEAWGSDALSALAQNSLGETSPSLERLPDFRLAEPVNGSDPRFGFRVSLLGQAVLAVIRSSK